MELGTEPGSGFEADETIPCLTEGKIKGDGREGGRQVRKKEKEVKSGVECGGPAVTTLRVA